MDQKENRIAIGSPAPAPVDDALFEAFAVVAGTLQSSTIKAIISDMEGWTGKEIEAARQALYFRLHNR